uniref:Uncharacterized protein n=1 Tax=Arundo donax TaxID=35708 RepID=A0A0A8Z0A3_ARUDO
MVVLERSHCVKTSGTLHLLVLH